MGLPVERLIVGTNRNDILARFLAANDMSMRGGRAQPVAQHGHPGQLAISSGCCSSCWAATPRRRPRPCGGSAPRAGCRCRTPPGAGRPRAVPRLHPGRRGHAGGNPPPARAGYLADPHTAIGTAAAGRMPGRRRHPGGGRRHRPSGQVPRCGGSAPPACAPLCRRAWPTYMSGRSVLVLPPELRRSRISCAPMPAEPREPHGIRAGSPADRTDRRRERAGAQCRPRRCRRGGPTGAPGLRRQSIRRNAA